MREYLATVADVLQNGSVEPNRTDATVISGFSKTIEADLADGFPLLTTKDLSGARWDSLRHEFIWYLSGEEHIRTLREETGIWDEWADEEGRLDTAYGRFWRRYPIPDEGLPGEVWATDDDHRWSDNEIMDVDRWINDEGDRQTFDQLQYIVDMLRQRHGSRRLVMSAWHPSNAAVSTLPPCHFAVVFNVQRGRLNLHLTQRSGDLALGVPFNIAAYSILLTVVAQRTGFEPGQVTQQIVDAHVYCGAGERGRWYRNHLQKVQEILTNNEGQQRFAKARDYIKAHAPAEPEGTEGQDHVPNLLAQLTRDPTHRPKLNIKDKPIDELEADDIQLSDYEADSPLSFAVLE